MEGSVLFSNPGFPRVGEVVLVTTSNHCWESYGVEVQTVGKFSRAGILEMEFIGGSSEKGKGVVESDCALGGFDGLLLNQASAP